MPAMPEKLPTLSAATLLRALFKRPARGASAGALATRFLLDRVDTDEVARYRRALGFEGTRIPLTYYYLPAQRAHLATMLGAAFPFRLVGAIHVDNALRSSMQPVAKRPLELATEVRIAPPSANGAVHAVLDTRATQDAEPVFACSSTYLVVRGKRSGGPRASATAAPALAPVNAWRLSAACGRHYAALSGDWNPIHLWPWSARMMGLKAPIIHGMHTLGRTCAELERAGGRPLVRLDGRFRATIELGAEAGLAASLADGRFTVETGGRIAVEGEFAFDASQPMQEAYPRS
jgi:acyl dehydratase